MIDVHVTSSVDGRISLKRFRCLIAVVESDFYVLNIRCRKSEAASKLLFRLYDVLTKL